MKSLFWSGKLSLPVMLMVNANNLISFVTGNAANTHAMKERVKLGYDGTFSDHVTRYDDLASRFQKRAAVTSNWWFARVPEEKRAQVYNKTKKYFERKGIRRVTDDVVIGYGTKPF